MHESIMFFANTTLSVGAPLPVIAHTIAHYNVSPRPPVIAMYTIQYCS